MGCFFTLNRSKQHNVVLPIQATTEQKAAALMIQNHFRMVIAPPHTHTPATLDNFPPLMCLTLALTVTLTLTVTLILTVTLTLTVILTVPLAQSIRRRRERDKRRAAHYEREYVDLPKSPSINRLLTSCGH